MSSILMSDEEAQEAVQKFERRMLAINTSIEVRQYETSGLLPLEYTDDVVQKHWVTFKLGLTEGGVSRLKRLKRQSFWPCTD